MCACGSGFNYAGSSLGSVALKADWLPEPDPLGSNTSDLVNLVGLLSFSMPPPARL